MAGDAGSGLSKGGMKTKLMAAKTATAAGCAMAITLGSPDNPLKRLNNGAKATWFLADGDPQAARKRWIATMPAKGRITVDEGAVAALKSGKSLLPAGIRAVSGAFERGDPVDILGPDDQVLGHGLTRYTAKEASAIMGRQSRDIPDILGYPGRAAFIHRDDMVV
jgi:glutamate 5-kinase